MDQATAEAKAREIRRACGLSMFDVGMEQTMTAAILDAYRAGLGDHEGDLASIADCVNTALRECERGGAQIREWTAPAIKDAIDELVYRNTELRQRVAALTEERSSLVDECGRWRRGLIRTSGVPTEEEAALRARLDAQAGEIAGLKESNALRGRQIQQMEENDRRHVRERDEAQDRITTLEATVAAAKAFLRISLEAAPTFRTKALRDEWCNARDQLERALPSTPACTCGDTEHQRGCTIFAVEAQRERWKAERKVVETATECRRRYLGCTTVFASALDRRAHEVFFDAVDALAALADPGATS